MRTTQHQPKAGQRPAAARHIGSRHLTTDQQRWQAYEAAKRLWESHNPGASCDEHEQAMRAIAQRVGV